MAISLSLLVGCGLDAESVGADGEEQQSLATARGSDATLQVQSGTRLLLLEVTDDNYAIYQEGSSVYATSLRAQAPRALIGDVPAGNFAFVYRVGKVAFVWTNPDRSLPGFGVSPLVIWSAASGAHLASPASPIGTLATSASRDGRYVVFPSNGSTDGATGDLEFASTDLSTRATLVSAAQMRFPNGPCRPLATFVDAGSGRDPVAAYCQGAATTATVSQWRDGQRRELVAAAVAPPLLSIDAERKLLLTQLAGSRYPVTVDLGDDREADHALQVVAEVAASFAFLGGDGAAFYTTRNSAGAELFRVRPRAVSKVLDLRGFLAFSFGSRSLTQPPTSGDGRSILSFDTFDPNTGLVNVRLSSARGQRPVTTLESQPNATLAGPAFTSHSESAIYASVTDPSTFFAELVVANAERRTVYSSDVWSWDVGVRGIVVFNERAVFNPADPFFTTADLRVVRTGSQEQPRLIATQAYTSFFPGHDRSAVVYATEQGPDGPGLYVSRLR